MKDKGNQTAKHQTRFAIGSNFPAALFAIAALGFLLRTANVLMTGTLPTSVNLIGDAAGYWQWAGRIAEGNWYGNETFYQAPLYPYVLALLRTIGLGIPGVRMVQSLFGMLSVVLLGLSMRHRLGDRVSLIGAAMLATFPPAIFYDGIIQKASLAALLLCALLLSISRLQQSPSFARAAPVGLFLGLLVLTRENAMLWVPLLGVWVIWQTWSRGLRYSVVSAAAYVGGLAVILMPVAARNASLGGEWSPTTFQAGPNFYIGNNLSADGIYRPLVHGHETPLYERSDAVSIAEETQGHAMTSREVSQFWMSRTWTEIKAAPGRWILLMLQKSFMLVNWFEVPDTESLSYYREYSIPLMAVRFWNFGVLFSLSMVGLWLSWHQWRELWIDYALILSMAFAIVLFFILGRYRLPLVPLLIPFAALGIGGLVQKTIGPKKWLQLRVPLLIIIVSTALCFMPVHDVSGLNASSEMNVGVAAAEQGNTELAIQMLRRAVRSQPYFAECHYNLGRALIQAGKPSQGIVSLQKAIELDSELPMADFMLGKAFEMRGDMGPAMHHYQRASRFSSDRSMSNDALERLRSNDAVGTSK
ncbi:MAG: glycosyltransferase family 39 protein [Pirellulaceae bacterium]